MDKQDSNESAPKLIEQQNTSPDELTEQSTSANSQKSTPKQTRSNSENTHITAADWVLGICLMLMSAVMFSFNGVLIKWASDIGYKSMEIFVFRSGFQLLVTVIATLFVGSKTSPLKFTISFEKFRTFKEIEKPLIKWIVLRGFFAGIAGICYFHAITIIPLGDAITVFSVYPVVTAFVAFIILRERISCMHGIALAAAIGGVYLIAKGSEGDNKRSGDSSWFQLYFGYIASAVGALSGGFVFVFIRLSTKRTPPIVLVYSHGFFCLLMSAIVGCFQGYNWFSDKSGETVIIMICFGLVGFFGQWTMNKSTQLIPAAVSSLIRSSDSVFSYVWEVVIFATIPTVETIVGAICVIFGIFLVALEKLRKAYVQQSGEEKEELNRQRKRLVNQYGSGTAGTAAAAAQSRRNDFFASNLSLLGPHDSHINLLARQ